jgi:citrate synthase
MLWLLMTGKVPTVEQTRQLSKDLAALSELPGAVEKLLDS